MLNIEDYEKLWAIGYSNSKDDVFLVDGNGEKYKVVHIEAGCAVLMSTDDYHSKTVDLYSLRYVKGLPGWRPYRPNKHWEKQIEFAMWEDLYMKTKM